MNLAKLYIFLVSTLSALATPVFSNYIMKIILLILIKQLLNHMLLMFYYKM